MLGWLRLALILGQTRAFFMKATPFPLPRPLQRVRMQSLSSVHAFGACTNTPIDGQPLISDTYTQRFVNTARLYAQDVHITLQRLSQAHVCVIGLGGVGSWAAESLARSGIGRFSLFDADELCSSNVNRQIHAVSGTVGRFKGDTLRDRIMEINPEAVVEVKHVFVRPHNALSLLTDVQRIDCDGRSLDNDEASFPSLPSLSVQWDIDRENEIATPLSEINDSSLSPSESNERVRFMRKFDFALDATDSASDKAAILDACSLSGTPVVTSGGAGGLQDPSLLMISDLVDATGDSLLKKVRDILREEYRYPKLFAGSRRKKWGIAAVHTLPTGRRREYSSEAEKEQIKTETNAAASMSESDSVCERPLRTGGGLRTCEGIRGSAAFTAGTMGLLMSSIVVNGIAKGECVVPKLRGRVRGKASSKNATGGGGEKRSTDEAEEDKKIDREVSCNCAANITVDAKGENNYNNSAALDTLFAEEDLDRIITHPLIDAHAHLQLSPLHEVSTQALSTAISHGVQFVSVCGTCPGDDWQRIFSLYETHRERVKPSFGLHPWWISRLQTSLVDSQQLNKEGDSSENTDRTTSIDDLCAPSAPWLRELEHYLQTVPSAGVGECGLDKPSGKKHGASMEKQQQILKRHIELARRYQRVLTIHCVGCWGQLANLLKEEEETAQREGELGLPSIILHSANSLPAEMVTMFMQIKTSPVFFSLSGGGRWTEDRGKLEKLLRRIPQDRLLIETDSPDQLPFELKSELRHNEPALVKLICKERAERSGLHPNDFAKITFDNTCRALMMSEIKS